MSAPTFRIIALAALLDRLFNEESEKVLFASAIKPGGKPNVLAAGPSPAAKSNVSLGFILELS